MRPLFQIALPMLPALLAGGLSLPSCAGDGCMVDPSDTRCTAMPSLDVNLLTNRLAKSGGRLEVEVRNYRQGEQIEVSLGTGGPKITGFMQKPDGKWEGMVSAAVLANIPIGPLSALVQVGTKTQTKTLHIYTPAVFMEDAKKITLNVGGTRQATWVQVSQGHVFTTLDSATNKLLNEYQVSGTTLTQSMVRESHRTPLSAGSFVDISETQTFRLPQPSGTTSTLDYADLTPTADTFLAIKMLNYAKANGLAVDRMSTLVAVAGEGTDGTLKAFSVPPMAMPMTSAMVAVNNVPAGKQAMQLGWGRIDNDDLLDLVAVHNDNSFAVYLQKSGTGLTYSTTFSTGLGMAATQAGLQAGMPPAFAVGDVDRDGLDDVMISPSGSMRIYQLANEGDGSFTKTDLVSGFTVDAIAIGDVTADSKVDLVVASKTPAMLYCYPNQSP